MSLSDGEPPRPGIVLWKYRWQSGSKAPPLLSIGGLLLFVGSIFLLLMGSYVRTEHRLSSEGKLTNGIVVKKVLNQASDNGTSSTSYEVDYTFTTADGQKIDGHDTVDPDAWDQLKEGGSVQIDYAASKPRINQIGPPTLGFWAEFLVLGLGSALWLLGAALMVKGFRARSSSQAGVAQTTSSAPSTVVLGKMHVKVDLPRSLKDKVSPLTFFGGFLLLFGAIFLLVGLANLRQERVFRAEGKTATAIVLTKSSHEEYDQQNDTHHTRYDLSYRFATAQGRSVEGSEVVNWRTWSSIHERDPIQIIYLPDRPSRNRLAAENPRIILWVFTVLGAVLTGGGTILLGYGVFGARRR